MPNQFDREGFLRVVEESGLTKTELATLYDTTRQTVYNWMAGGETTNRVLMRLYNKITAGLLKSITKRLLPFHVNVTKEERKNRVAAMVKVLHAQK